MTLQKILIDKLLVNTSVCKIFDMCNNTMVDISPVDTSKNIQVIEPNYFDVEKTEIFRQQKSAFIFTEDCSKSQKSDSSIMVGQGMGFINNENKKNLQSEGFATCLALVFKNIKTEKTALFHVDANLPRGIDQAVLNEISEGGGLIVIQAIRGSQSISSEETKIFFAKNINVNTLITEDILINTGSAFWSVTTNGQELEVDVGENGQKFNFSKENLTEVPRTDVNTDQLKIVSEITKDTNISNYSKGFKEKGLEEVFDQLNYLATFIDKNKSKWVNRWILSTHEDKKKMVATILDLSKK